MKCVICKRGKTRDEKTTVTLERGETTVVVKHVPAQICQNCGEEYVAERTTAKLFKLADQATRGGVQVDVREYLVA